MTPSTCAKVIYWRAKPGQFDPYTDDLRTQVEPIDHAALERGVLTRLLCHADGHAPRCACPRGVGPTGGQLA